MAFTTISRNAAISRSRSCTGMVDSCSVTKRMTRSAVSSWQATFSVIHCGSAETTSMPSCQSGSVSAACDIATISP